ncbi:aminodeoxychorismate lyase [Agromyces archimandritae]|uniref:Aminodeoxychorismate lyase n=1 Tax=Agromyces archimandritae TaxID=2781962 RepID=A0A975FK17_9MICO|nr:aminodeoxychorismate lyase [Agromyces archimandritae]QTX03960.1 aminodeoxychorismate lyase [Agromyces archimandritae]
MSHTVTLLIEPLPADVDDIDPDSTFHAVAPSAPALRVAELSTQRGDGIFETIAVVDGHAQEVGPHLERLRASARITDLPEPNLEQWRRAIHRAVGELPAQGEYSVKIVLSRGIEGGPTPTAWLMGFPSADHRAAREHGIRAVTLDRGYDHGAAERAPWLLLGAKTLSYAVNMAALREAKRRGADDAIFVSSDGYVLEGPTSSVVMRIGDEVATPAATGQILPGTTQRSLFSHLVDAGSTATERDIRAEELARADAVWLVSSVRLAVPVVELDGRPVPFDAAETAAFNAYLLSPRD